MVTASIGGGFPPYACPSRTTASPSARGCDGTSTPPSPAISNAELRPFDSETATTIDALYRGQLNIGRVQGVMGALAVLASLPVAAAQGTTPAYAASENAEEPLSATRIAIIVAGSLTLGVVCAVVGYLKKDAIKALCSFVYAALHVAQWGQPVVGDDIPPVAQAVQPVAGDDVSTVAPYAQSVGREDTLPVAQRVEPVNGQSEAPDIPYAE